MRNIPSWCDEGEGEQPLHRRRCPLFLRFPFPNRLAAWGRRICVQRREIFQLDFEAHAPSEDGYVCHAFAHRPVDGFVQHGVHEALCRAEPCGFALGHGGRLPSVIGHGGRLPSVSFAVRDGTFILFRVQAETFERKRGKALASPRRNREAACESSPQRLKPQASGILLEALTTSHKPGSR